MLVAAATVTRAGQTSGLLQASRHNLRHRQQFFHLDCMQECGSRRMHDNQACMHACSEYTALPGVLEAWFARDVRVGEVVGPTS